MKFHSTTLNNGLTVIGEQNCNAVSAAMGYFVKTGARDESAELAGVSHFLEHMMFKGTDKRSALDITYEMGAIGAQANAYTTEESTVYYMAVLPEYCETALELLSDMLRPSLDSSEFDVEKKVILEEIALYKDRPTYLLFETALREYFGKHPAGNSVLGSIESITALSRDQMASYFNQRYSADNIVFAVTGNFDWDVVLSLVSKYSENWPQTNCQRERPVHTPAKSVKSITKKDLHLAHRCMLAAGPSSTEAHRYAADVLSCILGDISGSKTYWQLLDKGLADSASIDCDEMDAVGVIYGYVSAAPDKIDEVGEILHNIMCSPADFEDEDLERAKTKLRTRLVLQGESSMRRLMAVGNDWLARSSYSTLEDELLCLKNVSRDSISELLEQYSFEPTASVTLVPEQPPA